MDLILLSEKETKDILSYLFKLSLKELRHRQCLIDKQIKIAYEKKNAKGLTNLKIMRDHLDYTVDIQSF